MKNYDVTIDDNWVKYVPEYDGNREDDDPVTVEIKPLTVREAQRRNANISARQGKNGLKTNAVDIQQDTFCSHVRNIENLTVGGQAIRTAEDLLGASLNGLVDEIHRAYSDISVLSEGDIKNFRSQFGGPNAPEAGIATHAPTTSGA